MFYAGNTSIQSDPSLTTTDATVTDAFRYDSGSTLQQNVLYTFTVNIYAYDTGTGDKWVKDLRFRLFGGATGLEAVGAVEDVFEQKDAGATAWAYNLDYTDPGYDFGFQIQGEEAKTINWCVTANLETKYLN